jgi:hypothetical protein
MAESRSYVREIARLKTIRSISGIRSDTRTVCASCLDRVKTPVCVRSVGFGYSQQAPDEHTAPLVLRHASQGGDSCCLH